MTRRSVYGFGLFVAVACTAMTIASIVMPRWISYGTHHNRGFSMGLHKRCSSVTGTCVSFPQEQDCAANNGSFCHMWRTIGFLMSLAVVIELCTVVSFVVIMAGGVQRRIAGYKVISSLLIFSALVQCAGMSIVAHLFENDDRFFKGWYLDTSFSLAATSWSVLALTALGIITSAVYLPQEGDYELIPDNQMSSEQDEQLQSRISGWNDGFRSGEYQNN